MVFLFCFSLPDPQACETLGFSVLHWNRGTVIRPWQERGGHQGVTRSLGVVGALVTLSVLSPRLRRQRRGPVSGLAFSRLTCRVSVGPVGASVFLFKTKRLDKTSFKATFGSTRAGDDNWRMPHEESLTRDLDS